MNQLEKPIAKYYHNCHRVWLTIQSIYRLAQLRPFASRTVSAGGLIFDPGKLAPVVASIANIATILALIAAILNFINYSFL
ncbi:hypothetical protein C7B79_13440 [Chroococcidiopsis cubana CCALA 043]|nr:hypothetical protein C7B79_13440 [Chroococcidiopsis cubana CCALA 043]